VKAIELYAYEKLNGINRQAVWVRNKCDQDLKNRRETLINDEALDKLKSVEWEFKKQARDELMYKIKDEANLFLVGRKLNEEKGRFEMMYDFDGLIERIQRSAISKLGEDVVMNVQKLVVEKPQNPVKEEIVTNEPEIAKEEEVLAADEPDPVVDEPETAAKTDKSDEANIEEIAEAKEVEQRDTAEGGDVDFGSGDLDDAENLVENQTEDQSNLKEKGVEDQNDVGGAKMEAFEEEKKMIINPAMLQSRKKALSKSDGKSSELPNGGASMGNYLDELRDTVASRKSSSVESIERRLSENKRMQPESNGGASMRSYIDELRAKVGSRKSSSVDSIERRISENKRMQPQSAILDEMSDFRAKLRFLRSKTSPDDPDELSE